MTVDMKTHNIYLAVADCQAPPASEGSGEKGGVVPALGLFLERSASWNSGDSAA